MKRKHLWLTAVMMIMIFTLSTVMASAATPSLVTSTNGSGAKVSVDWNLRYTYSSLETQLKQLNKAYPNYSKMYSIGKTYEDRNMWCMEITNESVAAKDKLKVSICGNIHGGERESASCAMYSAWYLLENSDTKEVAELLNHYIVYVIPVINPDGYEQSFIYNTRQNMRRVDHDGDGVAFNDNYKDINGDGYIGSVSAFNADLSAVTGSCGNESNDANHDGKLANDVKSSGVDLNRNFDFLWGQDGVMDTEGPSAASELETQAVQKFFDSHPDMAAMTTLHTGIQTVLYPWCYRDANKDLDNMDDINFMKDTSLAMATDMAKGTQRNFYTKSSFKDYQTFSELIDYTYGKYKIHSYTIEVYCGGSSPTSAYDPTKSPAELNDYDCCWNNTLPATTTVKYSHAEAIELLTAAGVDPTKLQVMDKTTRTYRAWGDTEGLQIQTRGTAQMVNKAPEDQDIMVSGIMDGILTMIKAEVPENGWPKVVAKEDPTKDDNNGKAPKTGDTNVPLLFVGILAVALSGTYVVLRRKEML